MTKRLTLTTALFLTTCACVVALPALAGFDFRSPTGVAAGPTAQRGTQAAVPTGEVEREELALPMPGENLGALQAPVQRAGAPEMTPGMKTLNMAAKPPMTAPEAAPQDTPQAPPKTPVVAGFGKDMPLAIALEQVLPKGMVAAPATGIDMGQRVTWEGGKPWQQVLDSMLAPKGLRSRVDGTQVRIENQPGAPQFPSPDKPMFADAPPEGIVIGKGKQRQGVMSETLSQPEPLPMPDSAAAEQPVFDSVEPISLAAVQDELDMQSKTPAPETAPPSNYDLSPNQPRRAKPAARVEPPPAPIAAEEDGLTYVPPTASLPEPAPIAEGPMSTPDNYQPPVAAQPTVMSDINRRDGWTALAGQDLRAVLGAWSQRANVQLVWDSPYQYAVQETQSDTTTYQQALSQLLDQYVGVGPKPNAVLHNGAGEQAVLVIR